MANEDFNATTRNSQRQTILNLYNSAIPTEIISFQLDISQEEVENIIEEERMEQEKLSLQGASSPDASMGLFYLDAVVNIDLAIKHAQNSMWEALKSEPKFDISMEETDKILEKFAKSKVTLVILHVDLVDSTRLLMTVDRLNDNSGIYSRNVLIIEAYGGYILKYIGDAIIAFFTVNIKDELYLPCVNAVNCARSVIKIIENGINPILDQNGYPEMSVRIGIDVGDQNAVLQYGWDIIHTLDNNKHEQIMKRPHYDIMVYTVSVAVKMTGLAKPNRFVVGQLVYDALDEKQKLAFKVLNVGSDIWSYVGSRTGVTYSVYSSIA
jgi:adenylate cyclase